jgi:hypothetical protein
MAENLSQQLSESLQNAQRNAETMRQLQMVKNTLFGAGGAMVGGMGHMAMGAYAGMGAMSPFAGSSAAFLGQAMGRGGYASASAFGPRVGGPGGLLYEAGFGDLLHAASGGILFQNVNKSISQTADQMRDSARSELRLRGQEFAGNVKYGALTLGGILDDSLVYRATGGFDERIKTGLTRQLADQMGGAIGRTGVAAGIVDKVTSRVGRLNAEQMGYGLNASQQEELSKLAIAFGGPVGSTTKDVKDKSTQFLDEFSKVVGKLGVSADKLMSGYQELVKAGSANLDSAKLFQNSIQTARSQNLFGSFGTDEFITQLASQTAIATSSRGLRGAQAEAARDARFRSIAQMSREFEVLGLNQSGVFGTGFAGVQNALAAREQLLAESMGAGGLFAASNQGAAAQMQAGGFSGIAGMLRGRAGATATSLQNPLFALRYKLFPEIAAAGVASRIGPAGVLSAALNKPVAFQRDRLLRGLSFAFQQEGLPADISQMDEKQRLQAAKIISTAYGITDVAGAEIFAGYLAKTPGGLESAAAGRGLSTLQRAVLNYSASQMGIVQEGFVGLNEYDLSGGKSVTDFLSGQSSDVLGKLARNDEEALYGIALQRINTEQLYFDILADPTKADKLIANAPDERTRGFIRQITERARQNRKLLIKEDQFGYSRLFTAEGLKNAIVGGGRETGSRVDFSTLLADAPLSPEGLNFFKNQDVGSRKYIRAFFKDLGASQQVDGASNSKTGPNEVSVKGPVDVNIVKSAISFGG